MLSQSHVWKIQKFGTTNQSQTGARKRAVARGSAPRHTKAATAAGTSRLVFFSQNHSGPSAWPLESASHHTCGLIDAAPPPSIHRTAGSPSARAGTKNASHCRRGARTVQHAASATIVP